MNEVSKLKQELDGDIVVPASFQLVRTLMEHDLVDELRLKIFPVVLGAGERLFGETSDKKPMRLVDTQTVEGDVAFLTYERRPGRLAGACRANLTRWLYTDAEYVALSLGAGPRNRVDICLRLSIDLKPLPDRARGRAAHAALDPSRILSHRPVFKRWPLARPGRYWRDHWRAQGSGATFCLQMAFPPRGC